MKKTIAFIILMAFAVTAVPIFSAYGFGEKCTCSSCGKATSSKDCYCPNCGQKLPVPQQKAKKVAVKNEEVTTSGKPAEKTLFQIVSNSITVIDRIPPEKQKPQKVDIFRTAKEHISGWKAYSEKAKPLSLRENKGELEKRNIQNR